MNNYGVEKTWNFFKIQINNVWYNIKELVHDEIDIKMLNKIGNNAYYKVFISEKKCFKTARHY